DLVATKPSFVIPASCPYDVTQDISVQLYFEYDEMKRAKARGNRIEMLVYAFYFGARLHTATAERTDQTALSDHPYEALYDCNITKERYHHLAQMELVEQAFP
ncbi:14597_t:CDS:2, partial [Racocetra persica]